METRTESKTVIHNGKFQKNLVVWKLMELQSGDALLREVSEELSSVETT